MITKIAIQGIKGSFHHQVAENYFSESVELEECMSFEKLVKNVKNDKSSKGIMALENSIAGSIIPNYALIDANNLHIIGEYYLDIHHNLLALKGQTIEDIKEVQSHPMALLQCAVFFSNYPHIKLIESSDTAETAKRIQEQKLVGVAAIASVKAADLYDLEIVANGIHTVKNNTTRFVIVKSVNKEIPKNEINKASLKFELEDKPGNLAIVLKMISDCQLNMTKIQSLPIIETPFQYSFFIDVVFENYKNYEETKMNLQQMTRHFKVLGEYKNARL
ncbi:MAG TPA: prephenate dehydratase [Flavobacterium sp.]|uniref:prephenate dehydratase n=1 Tax=unclassified Flavobacterium TaxID=196869 RepID=UPI000E823066|nr:MULTISPECIES: prephenate dehydratase [unclassified Flavobacterium]HBI02032.1 prephenate dehydratase [Flavobacterium sp.]HRE77407.1 prephenate dehydratase [Flavobacterium sp.]